jgi:hypothetical protein
MQAVECIVIAIIEPKEIEILGFAFIWRNLPLLGWRRTVTVQQALRGVAQLRGDI